MKTIDEILSQFATHVKRSAGGRQVGGGELSQTEAKQAITQAILDALPEKMKQTKLEDDSDWFYGYGYNQAIDHIESAIKKKGEK